MFGVPDVRMGEEVAAWVKLNDGAEKITAEQIQVWCKEKVRHLVCNMTGLFPKKIIIN